LASSQRLAAACLHFYRDACFSDFVCEQHLIAGHSIKVILKYEVGLARSLSTGFKIYNSERLTAVQVHKHL
jgi:hypothetical protein